MTWSCIESLSDLCFCSFGTTPGDLAACSPTWTCCFSGSPTSCECVAGDEATCAETLKLDSRLKRIAHCPGSI